MNGKPEAVLLLKYGKTILGSVRNIDNVSIAGFVTCGTSTTFYPSFCYHISGRMRTLCSMFIIYFLMLGVCI